MKTISRYIMTLALLLTAVTGAWAQDTYTVTFKANGNTKTVENVTLPHTFELDPIIKELYPSLSGGHGSPAGTSASGNTNVTAYYNNDKHYANISASFEGAVTVTGQFFKDFNNHSYTLEINCMEELVAISDDKTEATFAMPAFDATVNYELVRDMSVSMPVTVGDGTEGADYRIRLKKDGNNKWALADMTVQDLMGKIKVHDALENKDLTFTGNEAVCAISIFAIDEQDQPTGNAIAFADLTPGRYVAIATAKDGTAYDGTTDMSNVIVLFQGIPIVVPPTEEGGDNPELGIQSYYTEDYDLKLDANSNAQLYTITAVGPETATARPLTIVAAGTPFFILNQLASENNVLLLPTAAGETPDAVTPAEEFKGTATSKAITAADMAAYYFFAFHHGALYHVDGAGEVPANKCYLQVQVPDEAPMRRIVFEDGEATGIDEVAGANVAKDDSWYDLSGRKLNVKPAQKGVYIVNGKKVVVK